MLEDISNPFNEVVNRPTRPSHHGGRGPDGARAARRPIVPVPVPAGRDGATEPADGQPTPPVAPITTAPGPREVSAPAWWRRTPSPQS
jgi:hypothetical protein